MTLALPMAREYSVPPTVDRGISEDAQEVRRIRARARYFETSYSLGISKWKAIEALRDAFAETQDAGWDGYASERVQPGAILYAMNFLQQLPSNLPPPEIAVDVDGEIAFEWDFGPRRIISVRIGRDGTLTYAGLLGHAAFHGIEIPYDGIPEAILSGIRRIVQAP